jgi:hypothetical protein
MAKRKLTKDCQRKPNETKIIIVANQLGCFRCMELIVCAKVSRRITFCVLGLMPSKLSAFALPVNRTVLRKSYFYENLGVKFS